MNCWQMQIMQWTLRRSIYWPQWPGFCWSRHESVFWTLQILSLTQLKLPRPKGVINFHNIQQVSLDSTQLFWSMILNRFFYGEVDGIIGILNVIQQIFSGLHGWNCNSLLDKCLHFLLILQVYRSVLVFAMVLSIVWIGNKEDSTTALYQWKMSQFSASKGNHWAATAKIWLIWA